MSSVQPIELHIRKLDKAPTITESELTLKKI